jgi:5-methylcytosine-specific restriction endonuclease McrA
MCHGVTVCSELGGDPKKWSKRCPLPVPGYFNDAVESFTVAIQKISEGNQAESLRALAMTNSELVRRFYIDHGQQSSYFRVPNRLEIDNLQKLKVKSNKTKRMNPKVEKEVFERDSYRCRYCELRIISKDVFSHYSQIVGPENFSVERANEKRNGLTLGLRGVADHVDAYASGGETLLENLVTSCYSCNFGKSGYTLEQIGIEDPRKRKPNNDGWMGLTEYLKILKEKSKTNKQLRL